MKSFGKHSVIVAQETNSFLCYKRYKRAACVNPKKNKKEGNLK
jgi:hypothetical protein